MRRVHSTAGLLGEEEDAMYPATSQEGPNTRENLHNSHLEMRQRERERDGRDERMTGQLQLLDKLDLLYYNQV